MYQLEYRLRDETPIYHFKQMEIGQIFAHRTTNHHILDGKTYSIISAAVEEELFVIYVDPSYTSLPNEIYTYKTPHVELHLESPFASILIDTIDCIDFMNLQIYMGTDYFNWKGKTYTVLDSVVDTGRGVYMLIIEETI
ncbi:hypothetical protein bcgnr5378_07820 [Bacillus cereus]|nr:hypothetical protein [Bacillus cereus]HDR8330083.1 hypothetical protein [Bacillus cereus]HDR8337055.1 hypothetical protein [Bacillus cereus]